MNRIVEAKAVGAWRVFLRYEDGVQGEVNLDHLRGKGVFAALADETYFSRVKTGPCGELCWGDEIDLCPDALYATLTGKPIDEVLKDVATEAVDAGP